MSKSDMGEYVVMNTIVSDQAVMPVWTRLPKSGTLCHLTGLTRTGINLLVLGEDPPVKSVVVRQPGKGRGVRLVLVADLLAYIESEFEKQQEERATRREQMDKAVVDGQTGDDDVELGGPSEP